MMDELTQLAIKYGTDKWGKHHYTPVYYELFKDKRQEVKKVLEIGPAEGAGLFMFRDFFPNATIYGAEIDHKRVDALQGLERIKVFQCDQSNVMDLTNLENSINTPQMDLIIDDGSHKPEDQIFTALDILPTLKSGAVYIIEDVSDVHIARKLIAFQPEVKRVGTRYDDQLIICQK